ncbi:biogenesis of lysosome-related organelles complex 1 subunit 6 [Exaiptasia diaphana]|uniref:Biogenesis of lysosome-related organelles complex 1 subunit 6 n=1 Tax=Exaiptasia diaphana TaxID=2652724 RepID=A0A913X9N0_EXADI|nr:biogenesis of lysosome-related organelles complex 1 subunit 6 [Exaiptasia diaphana]
MATEKLKICDVEKEIKELEGHSESMEQINEETQKAIEMLTSGIMTEFLPEMDDMKSRIKELTQNQGILIETIQQENTKFLESHEAKALREVVSQVQKYNNKLKKIHNDMGVINERIARLKRRAHKLKQHKEREEKIKQDARKREQEIEQELIAKPATKQKS